MKKDTIPGRNSNMFTYAGNFIKRLDKHSGKISMSVSEVEHSKYYLERFRSSYSKMISLKAESKAATENFYSEKKKITDLIRKLSKRIKTSHLYSNAIGEDFKIINKYNTITDFSKHKPVLKAAVNAKVVTVKFTKNRADGIKLYSKRGSENKFTEIAIKFRGAFMDKRPKLKKSDPEAREYYAEYIVKDKVVGKRSDIIKVVIP